MPQRTLFDPQPEVPETACESPSAPYQAHSPTSKAAAKAIEPRAATLRRAILDYIRSRGEEGATDTEMQDALSMPGDTQRPRRTELVAAGLVIDSGRTRNTSARRKAIIWIATQHKEHRS